MSDQKRISEKKPWTGFELVPCPNKKDEYPLLDFQQYITYLKLSMWRVINGAQTGLGKTVTSLSSYYYYKMKYPKTKLIIITTKSAILQYKSEFYKFFEVDERIVCIYQGMKDVEGKKYADKRKKAYEEFAMEGEGGIDVLIMNYSTMRLDRNEIEWALYNYRTANEDNHIFSIFDEGTYFCNFNATSRAVSAIAKRSEKVIVLTATATKGKLEQLYGMARAIGIQLSKNKTEFEEDFCIIWQHQEHHYLKKITGYKNIDEFYKRFSKHAVVVRKTDVSDSLPKFLFKKVYLFHSKIQIKTIKEIYEGAYQKIPEQKETEQVINPSEFQRSTDYEEKSMTETERKELSGGVISNFQKMALLDHRTVTKEVINYKKMSPKTEEICRALAEDYVDEKIVIYSNSKRYVILLAETIRKNKDVPDNYKTVFEIHGGVSTAMREEQKVRFDTDPMCNIMIINNAGIEAINLQIASVLMVTTMPQSGGDLVQLAGRLSRLGSNHKHLSLIYLLTENSQDEDDYQIIQEQLVIMYHFLGESEVGLIDWDFLTKKHKKTRKEIEAPYDRTGQDEVDADKYNYLMDSLKVHKLSNRKKRKNSYMKGKLNTVD